MDRRLPFGVAVLAILSCLGCGDAGRLDQTCSTNADCAEDELCGTGFCGGFGNCIARPESCDDVSVNLVCGCDGRTYDNACEASLTGIRLRSTDACVCGSNDDCVDGQFCSGSESCTLPGECVSLPETCDPTDTQIVCGCDGETYENACAASQSSVRVSALGACECPATACSPDDYCNALVCDGPGVCDSRTAPCEPGGSVVGCDGIVYENACVAQEAGVRVRP